MTASAEIEFRRKSPPGGLAFANAKLDGARAAMRQLASGVCLVTRAAAGTRVGATATAAAASPLDPSTLIVCVNRASSNDLGLTKGASFGVSVLDADQAELAERFAGRTAEPAVDPFRDARWLIAPSGAPLLWDALAAFEVEVDALIERDAHAIVVGRILRAAVGSGAGALIRWRGRYDQLGWTRDELARATGVSPNRAAS